MNQEMRDEIADMVKDGAGTVLIWAMRAYWTICAMAFAYVAYLLVTGKF